MARSTRERLRTALGPKPRNVVGVGAILALSALAVVASHWAITYGAGLLAFSVWMIWFVLVVVELLEVDFGEEPDGDADPDADAGTG